MYIIYYHDKKFPNQKWEDHAETRSEAEEVKKSLRKQGWVVTKIASNSTLNNIEN